MIHLPLEARGGAVLRELPSDGRHCQGVVVLGEVSCQGGGVDEIHYLKRGIRKELQGALKGAILVTEGAFLAADLRGLCWPKEGVTKLAGSLDLERANLYWLGLMLPHL